MKKLIKLLLITVLIIMPNIVKANTESYVHYENILMEDDTINGWSSHDGNIYIDMDNAINYSFDIKGYNLEEEETYVLELSSDFFDYSSNYTGEELMNGINIKRSDGNGTVYSRIYLESSKENIKSKITTYEVIFDNVYFRFNDNFDSTELDEYFNKIAPNGKIKLNAVKLDDFNYMETSISSALSKYNTDNFWVIGGCYEGYDNCTLYMSDNRYDYRYKEYDIEYIFLDTDNEILSKVNTYIKKFKDVNEVIDGDIKINMFTLDDLENINYKYTVIKNGREDVNTINSIINYSSEIQSLLEYGNLTATIDTRAGWGDRFTAGGYGYINLLYNDIFYGAEDRVGVQQINVLYVSDDTKDTREDYINAAVKRVRDYLPNAKVELTYAGQISDLDNEEITLYGNYVVDINKTLGEYYTLSIDNNEYSFFIVKDSSKIKNPKMNTVDMKTKIKVNSDSYEVPLDSKISTIILNKNSSEYKEILDKLKLNTGIVIDINLFSDLRNAHIIKLDNGKFKVYIPIEEDYKNKELKAYYIKDDNSIEVYNITKEDGYAIFETDHFSTYTIGYTSLDNPDTSDNILSWFIYMFIALTSLIFVILCKHKLKVEE